MNLHFLANPARFQRWAGVLLPWLAAAAACTLGLGLWLGLFVAPPDYQQGETVRIMFVHVPAAWLGMFVYGGMAVASAVALVWKHPLADVAAKASAPVGACFTALALVTGSLWGKPMWGTWWVWDARLTSMLVLLFIYIGYMALWDAVEDPARAAKAAAILCLVGAVDLPIIKFSVDWWNTLHQPASVVRLDGPRIHPSILWPLLTMILAFTLYYFAVLIVRMRAELAARRVRVLREARVMAADGPLLADAG